MKKILLAIDAVNPDMASLDFACYLARLTKSRVTGVFLENLVDDERPVLKQSHEIPYVDWEVDRNAAEYLVKSKMIEENIQAFKQACSNREVNCNLHRDRGVPTRELIDETRFADLLVIDSHTTFRKHYEGQPTGFVREVLKDAECPVLVAPENFQETDELVFTYNGSKSSMFAIKQFTYVLPELGRKKVFVLQINNEGDFPQIDKYKFKEWLKNHYRDVEFQEMEGAIDSVMVEHLLERRNAMVILGAYGRNTLSLFFRHSRADVLIQTLSQPLFIAHY